MNNPALSTEHSMPSLKQLEERAAPKQPKVSVQVIDNKDHYAMLIPKKIAVQCVRESDTEKHSLFFTAVPTDGNPGSCVVTLQVQEGEASAPVRFRLGSMNIFVAAK